MALAFLTEADLLELCSQDELDIITNSSDAVIEGAELKAIEVFKDYLRNRYNVTLCFAPATEEADNRNKGLVMFLTDYLLYVLYANQPDRLIPEIKVQRKDEALEWLKMISAGRISPDLPTQDSETETDINSPVKVGYSTRKMTNW